MQIPKIGPSSGGENKFSTEPIQDVPAALWRNIQKQAKYDAKDLKESDIEQKEKKNLNPEDKRVQKEVFKLFSERELEN
ncbi:MAG TPA: hypothetical protein VMR37_06330 [Rhabdochlamydiaceae bacterium]|jgi:hypothetical protein|nr:hypothetical protein [Rhabdochlamydiaceae bacterium]